jgi:hypothetical protein
MWGHNFRAKIPVYLLNGGFLVQKKNPGGIVNLTTLSAYKTPCVFGFQNTLKKYTSTLTRLEKEKRNATFRADGFQQF